MSESFLAAASARAADVAAAATTIYCQLLNEDVKFVNAAARLLASQWPAIGANTRKMSDRRRGGQTRDGRGG